MGVWFAMSDNGYLPVEEDTEIITQCKSLLFKTHKLLTEITEWEVNLKATEIEHRRLYSEHTDSILRKFVFPDLPVIYVITPTYTRLVQKAELIRLVHTFLHIKGLHWIVVEDSKTRSRLVARLLEQSGVSFTHLNAVTPAEFRLKPNESSWRKPRGVWQRNEGLKWIRSNLKKGRNGGVVYFADDDNVYDLKLFEEMRYTKRVSVWPVAFIGDMRYESPVVDNGHVIGWLTNWKPFRPFALDMAGFAINIDILLDHGSVEFLPYWPIGEFESLFLVQLVTLFDLEPKANNCKQILVWHTQTSKPSLYGEVQRKLRNLTGTDPKIEV